MKNLDRAAAPIAAFYGSMPALSERWKRHLSRMVAALGAGGSTIPFGDNGDVFRALAETRAQERARAA
jgi:hypothetical protein